MVYVLLPKNPEDVAAVDSGAYNSVEADSCYVIQPSYSNSLEQSEHTLRTG